MNQRTNTQGALAFPGEQTEPVGRTSHSAHSIWPWQPWLAAGKERSNFKLSMTSLPYSPRAEASLMACTNSRQRGGTSSSSRVTTGPAPKTGAHPATGPQARPAGESRTKARFFLEGGAQS